MAKLPDDANQILQSLNKLKTKKALCDHFGVTRSGLYSYERRNGIKFERAKPTWEIKYENNKKDAGPI